MKGINYVIDEDGNKTAVQIDLQLYGELWENFYDLLIYEARKDEESISLESVLKELQKEGIIDERVQNSVQ